MELEKKSFLTCMLTALMAFSFFLFSPAAEAGNSNSPHRQIGKALKRLHKSIRRHLPKPDVHIRVHQSYRARYGHGYYYDGRPHVYGRDSLYGSPDFLRQQYYDAGRPSIVIEIGGQYVNFTYWKDMDGGQYFRTAPYACGHRNILRVLLDGVLHWTHEEPSCRSWHVRSQHKHDCVLVPYFRNGRKVWDYADPNCR